MGKIYGAFRFTGPDSLASKAGNQLDHGDAAIVFTGDATLIYTLNSTSGANEDIPKVIKPELNADDKRWLLVTDTTSNAPSQAQIIAYIS